MARIDLVALQQRLAQQQPPVPAEPPSGSTRPAPASTLRTTAVSKARPAASAAAPAGTLRATATMRAALPLKATNARAERAEERVRANALRAQIDELNAEMVEADRALAEERQRADRLSERVEAMSAEVLRAEKQTEAVVGRVERAEAGRDAERDRAEALRTSIDELKAGQAMMAEMHARELAVAQHDALAAQQGAAALRQAEAVRRALGRWARLRRAWRGE
jgi:chemosensory pili system protein ChpA (sensor histidine kinase/response regulator)